MRYLALASAAVLPAAAASADFVYSYDDGNRETNIGPPSSFDKFDNTDMIWGNYFNESGGNDELTGISLSIGTLFESPATISLIVWDDANNDGDPTDISSPALTSFDVEVTETSLGEMLEFDLPSSVQIDGGFFVAAALRGAEPGEDRPASVDTDASGENSWLIYSPDLNTGDLATSIGFATRMDNTMFVPFPGAFVLRANAVPGVGSAGVLALAGLGAMRRRR